MPYDEPQKTLTSGNIADRVRELGGPILASEAENVRIYGDPDRVPAGPSVLGTEIARRRGFDIERTPDE
ncbi:hypothetical protein IAE22_35670, partial [Bacillus sp. S34]|nr:hypothetical protein [Bacillus sp. S34]